MDDIRRAGRSLPLHIRISHTYLKLGRNHTIDPLPNRLEYYHYKQNPQQATWSLYHSTAPLTVLHKLVQSTKQALETVLGIRIWFRELAYLQYGQVAICPSHTNTTSRTNPPTRPKMTSILMNLIRPLTIVRFGRRRVLERVKA